MITAHNGVNANNPIIFGLEKSGLNLVDQFGFVRKEALEKHIVGLGFTISLTDEGRGPGRYFLSIGKKYQLPTEESERIIAVAEEVIKEPISEEVKNLWREILFQQTIDLHSLSGVETLLEKLNSETEIKPVHIYLPKYFMTQPEETERTEEQKVIDYFCCIFGDQFQKDGLTLEKVENYEGMKGYCKQNGYTREFVIKTIKEKTGTLNK